jgi:hypothetical protein
VNGWIKVETELPPEQEGYWGTEAVLVWDDEKVSIGHYDYELKCWCVEDMYGPHAVTHWMALPAGPA